MSPAEVIERAAIGGVQLVLSPSGSISAKGVQSTIDQWLPAIRRVKGAIVLLLQQGADCWSGEDWRAFFDERRGIAELDTRLSREQAEARAFTCCVAEWMNRNPARSPPGRCVGCGEAEYGHDPFLPFGIEPTGHAWLHSRCWFPWHASRKVEAVTALSTFGITDIRNLP